jgi:hypothetical protein
MAAQAGAPKAHSGMVGRASGRPATLLPVEVLPRQKRPKFTK